MEGSTKGKNEGVQHKGFLPSAKQYGQHAVPAKKGKVAEENADHPIREIFQVSTPFPMFPHFNK